MERGEDPLYRFHRAGSGSRIPECRGDRSDHPAGGTGKYRIKADASGIMRDGRWSGWES